MHIPVVYGLPASFKHGQSEGHYSRGEFELMISDNEKKRE
jgi:hypothetical protein